MYLLISVLVLFVSYRLFKKASGTLDIREINISSFVFYSLFLMTFMGSLQIQYGLIADGYVPEDDRLRTYGWMVVMYAMVMVPIGMLIACRIFKVNSMRDLISRYNASPLDSQDISWETSFKHSQYIFSLLSILAVSFIIYMHGESVPLFDLLRGSQDYFGMGMLRHDSGFRNVEYGEYIKIIIAPLATFSTIFSYSAYCYFKSRKQNIDIIWLALMVFICLLLNTYALVKSPIIYWIIGIMVVHRMITGKLSFKVLLLVIGVIALLVGLSTIYVQGTRENIDHVNFFSFVSTTVEVFFHRITFGQVFVTYLCLDYFPEIFPHLLFSSSGKLLHQLFNMPYSPDYGIIVMSIWRPIWATAGHATTYFMGEAWANFGLIGVLLAPLWVGFFIQSLHIGFLKLRKTALNVALYGFSFTIMPTMTGLQGFYYPEGFIEYFIIIVMMYATASLLKFSRRY